MQGVRRYHEGGGARGRRAGFAFISAVIFLGVVLLLGASMVEQSNQELATASRAKKDTQAFNLAEAGIDYAAWRLYCDRAGTALPVTWTRTGMGGGDFSVTASQYGASSDTVVLDSTGTAQGYTARVKVVGKFLTQPTGPQSAVFDYGLFSHLRHHRRGPRQRQRYPPGRPLRGRGCLRHRQHQGEGFCPCHRRYEAPVAAGEHAGH